MNIITGNKFKIISDYILDENGFRKNSVINNVPIFFIKTDFIDVFFKNYKPSYPYKIITHNSDYHISDKHKKYLDDIKLISWWGQNIDLQHNKLKSIPIGIANEQWEHGNEDLIKNIAGLDNKNIYNEPDEEIKNIKATAGL